MRNPWLKKNPLLSMWLSGANTVAGAARARGSAEFQRQAAAASAAVVKGVFAAALAPSAPRKRAAKVRKRK